MTIFIGVTTFIMYFIFNMIGIVIFGVPSIIVSNVKSQFKKDKSDTEDMLKNLKKVSSGAIDWRLPLCAILNVFLASFFFNLLHTSTFVRGLFFLTFALYALLSYLDKVFTHMGRKLLPSMLETCIYLVLAIVLLHVHNVTPQ